MNIAPKDFSVEYIFNWVAFTGYRLSKIDKVYFCWRKWYRKITGFGMSEKVVQFGLFVNGGAESSDQVFNLTSGF